MNLNDTSRRPKLDQYDELGEVDQRDFSSMTIMQNRESVDRNGSLIHSFFSMKN